MMNERYTNAVPIDRKYRDNFRMDGKNADNITADKKYKEVCRKAFRAVVLTAGGTLLMTLLVPAGILFLGISIIWKITDYLLKKTDKR